MDSTRDQSLRFRLSIAILCFFLVASSIVLLCDTRSHGQIFLNIKLNHRISSSSKPWKNLKSLKHFLDPRDINSPLFSFSNFDDSYGSPSSSSSVSLPPSSSQAPQPTSSSSSPYSPVLTPPSLPEYSPISHPPPHEHHPPPPPQNSQSPSPHSKHGPSPPKTRPSPPMAYSPPNGYTPPPSGTTTSTPPPPHNKKPQSSGHWCVAKPTVPDAIIKQAMDYACGSGADCKEIQPNGPCYEPNSMLAHASYAFNSYWQNRKASGGTCDFGGTAMLVTVDPSFGKCHFMMN
ncbi:leucine-rich repeat extensin-like protein 3 [Neltuma alba]|uniref:leucine-rich repeat extensin-like protein 3 n=1 Tax=Neltuma alba TaxID=207710 RepID=UPI0010A2E83E|nr:leucine-rich repeat extensin-like protein 3 [Prosopis alba]XP_028779634.1 leucine-rich repeat extensin-like protein 3 [Prosopis alba]